MMYLVRWSIDLDAETPEEAAAEALRIQRDTGSTATFFEVFESHEPNTLGNPVLVEADDD